MPDRRGTDHIGRAEGRKGIQDCDACADGLGLFFAVGVHFWGYLGV